MATEKSLQQIVSLTLAVLLLSGCARAPTRPALEATPVPLTPIPPTATLIPVTPTAVPTETVSAQGGFQPLSSARCGDLMDGVAQTLGLEVTMTQAPFEDHVSGQAGVGCQLTANGTGVNFENVDVIYTPLTEMLQARGWYEDIAYSGGGPGAMLSGFRQADELCLVVVSSGPTDADLCPDDKPFAVCWEKLTPNQRLYTIVLNCVQGIPSAAVQPQPEPEPERIQFAPGATSGQVQNSLLPGEGARYVLAAMADQEMTVNLSATTTSGTAGGAILIIWGADGTVLISDHADATTWAGILSSTQDYYINVRSLAQESVNYVLEVVILPATDTAEAHGLPRQVPSEFQSYLQVLAGTGVPPMLPPQFPVDEGLPPVFPYIYTAEPGEYELSLDYGADCHGAGACHYGSLTGKKVDAGEPVGTRNFPFEAERAQKVTLADGIEGYFIEARCGASCDDAKVFWMYNGYQYMVGVKGGPQSDVVALANAAITNFAP